MTLTAAQILAVKVPEALFSGPNAVAAEYKALVRKYHPDANGDSDESKRVSSHINVLHDEAKKKIELGKWEIPGQLDLFATNGKHYRIRFERDFDIGIGKGYIGKTVVAYVFSKDVEDLVNNGLAVIKKCILPTDEKLKKNLTPVIPKVKAHFKTDDKIVVVMERSPKTIRLRDAYDFCINPAQKTIFNEKFDPRHVAWIMSRCYYFECFMESIGYGHHDLSMDSIFIDPEAHSISVLGGWWYASPVGERMKRLQTSRTLKYAPRSVLTSKTTSLSTDLETIRLLGRELLGDPTGVLLSKDTNIKPYMINWLRMVTSGNARTDYKNWYATLEKIFGERKFTVLSLTAAEVYK